LESSRTILELEDVVSGYGDLLILSGVTFSVESGQIVSIIGANGAGKSTLLRTIFGLVELRDGHIHFDGDELFGLTPIALLKRGIVYVRQGRGNLPAMTVRENLEMGAYIRTDKDVDQDIEAIMDRFALLRDKRGEFAGNLSGGQQQILEMGMALLLHPKLIMLDEPSLGLSPAMADQVFEAIQELNADGTTILLVEQNAKRALSISHQGVVLELGRVRQQGAGDELLQDEALRRHYLGG
jgi:ABC-type branched-subunit amino acid transport system ATPase component